ncbi:MAG: hypothetical protein S4CHLAM2_10620 [Chlamydiales bacterium]|nr:hypothetical protein [Chlamydiales bacterium]
MSRRDTIIVAVLVNAALLMILFATAVRSDNAESAQQVELAEASSPKTESKEVDLFHHYATSVPTLAEAVADPTPFTEEIELAFNPPELVQQPKKHVETPKTEPHVVDVTVKKGDFLEKIANANNTTVSAIMKANQLSSTQLKIGQVLKVPVSETKPKPISKPSLVEEYYVVKDGDNPWVIASRNNLRLDELLKLNGLDDQKARRLRPGDRLRIK